MFSTIRDSATVPYHWRKDLEFQEIDEIQRECGEAMKLWGYRAFLEAEDIEKVWPVARKYQFAEMPS